MRIYQTTEWSHALFRLQVQKGGNYIDATMGNGKDTLFLCELAGESGRVTAFDIQEQALENTRQLLEKHQMEGRAKLLLESHDSMDRFFEKESVDGIYFNFGYLPGGDHRLSTKAATSIKAVRQSLGLLKRGGILALLIYSGGDTGFEEKEALLAFLKDLDEREYLVIVNEYFNRKKNPPLPVFVVKR